MHQLGIFLVPDFQLAHLAVATVFEFANARLEDPAYAVRFVSVDGGLVRSSSAVHVDSVKCDGHFDTLIVTGDMTGEPAPDAVGRLRRMGGNIARLASTCAGAFVLAEAGFLDGAEATTHWLLAARFRERYPHVRLTEDRIYVNDGRLWTSAGGTAALDLALAMVEADLGTQVAADIARKLVMVHRRQGGQSQFSTLLSLDARTDRLRSALEWARENLHAGLGVEDLARVANLSPRQFSRSFRQETGQSPARAVEQLRVEAARRMLDGGRFSLDTIATRTGFGDRDRMRRAFVRMFGHPPSTVRRLARPRSA